MNKLTVFNAESAYYYYMDEVYRNSILGSHSMYCDSASLSYVLRFWGVRHSRLHGPDFMDFYLRRFRHEAIMVVGGTECAHNHIRSNYQLTRAKFIDCHISTDELSNLYTELKTFCPKMVFVCLGLRKQEAVVNAIWQNFKDTGELFDTTIIGVGAAVDFLGGTKVRSGKIWRALGLEWFPRLLREPRMAPRVLRSFMGCIFVLVRSKKFNDDKLSFAEKFDAV